MSNWKTEYRITYHVVFEHYDGKVAEVYNELVVEAESKKKANQIIFDMFDNKETPLIDLPKGWHGFICGQALKIDKTENIWEY